jgi:dinuclear metal center YbgI/SA1388 family protein
MIKRDELINFIHSSLGDDLLAAAQKVDQNANGVQIHGAKEVTKIAVGVSANLDFFRQAVAYGAQFCLFHHGLHLSDRYIYNSRLDPALENQLKFVVKHDLTVAGYHYALDHHPTMGNNAQIIQKLGARRLATPYFDDWGWVAEFTLAQDVKNVAKMCSDIFKHEVFAVYAGPVKIKRIGVVSGGGKPTGSWLFEIFEKKIDLHLTGEIAESGPAIAKDGGFNYFACGHYATEVFGVHELGKAIKDHYQDRIEVEFIDIANPL